MTGELAGYAMERLLDYGALDVFYTPIYMKKNRPAFKLSVICKEEDLHDIKRIVLKETTTIGLRMYKVERECLDRKIEIVNTKYGESRVKVAFNENTFKVTPEYEDCKKLAVENCVSLEQVYNEVKTQYLREN